MLVLCLYLCKIKNMSFDVVEVLPNLKALSAFNDFIGVEIKDITALDTKAKMITRITHFPLKAECESRACSDKFFPELIEIL